MDTLAEGKDTDLSTHYRPRKGQALVNFFMGIGFFIGFLILFSILAVGVYALIEGASMTDLLDPSNAASINNSTNGLRILNLFSSALPLLLAAWLATRIGFKGQMHALYGKSLNINRYFFLSLLFLATVIPLVGVLVELNSKLDVSFISESLQEWIIGSESQNNRLYEIIAGNGSMLDLGINLVLMAALPALAEEFFFRGFLLNIFRSWFKNPHVGIWLSALVFGVIHMQFLKVLPMICLGAAFGYLVYWNASIWPAILAHFVNNALAVIALHMNAGDYSEVLSKQSDIPPVAIAILTLAVIALFYFLQKNSNPKLSDPYA